MRLVALALVLMTAIAHADGFYYSQGYGISSARDGGAAMLGESLQLRIAVGWRFGAVTVGPWVTGHLAWDREGALLHLVGGEPESGDSDLKHYGVDARYHATIHGDLVMYVRGGPRYASALGALEGYRGFGVGVATGVQYTRRVRALGFLFAPLFFFDYGPMVTASLFLDQNVDWLRLHAPNMPELSMPLVGTSIGIGAGSHF